MCVKPFVQSSDEGLTLRNVSLKLFTVVNLCLFNLVDNTKLLCYTKGLSRTWKQRDDIISRCHDLVKLAGSSFMPTDIWYIWYINVRRGARVDICVIIYDCVNKRDGENFQVVKNVFVHASGNILGVAFVSTLLFWEIIFKLKGKRTCDQASALKWETLSHALQQKRYLKHLTDKELFYCKLEKVIRFADSSLLVLFVSLSSAPFFSFPFFL